jgi:hypothetical protein
VCEPSQKGALALALHRQSIAAPSFSAVNLIGSIPVPAWEPSQNGCFDDSPQAQ